MLIYYIKRLGCYIIINLNIKANQYSAIYEFLGQGRLKEGCRFPMSDTIMNTSFETNEEANHESSKWLGEKKVTGINIGVLK